MSKKIANVKATARRTREINRQTEMLAVWVDRNTNRMESRVIELNSGVCFDPQENILFIGYINMPKTKKSLLGYVEVAEFLESMRG